MKTGRYMNITSRLNGNRSEQKSVHWQWKGIKKRASISHCAHRIRHCPVYTLHCKKQQLEQKKKKILPTFCCSLRSVSSVRHIGCSTCATNPVNTHLDLWRDVLQCSRWKISKPIVSDIIQCLLSLWIFTVDCTGQVLQSSLSKWGQNDPVDCRQHI